MSRQPPSYRPNMGRNVTKKWVEARQPDYDDGWGDEDEGDQQRSAIAAPASRPRGLSFGQDDERRAFSSEQPPAPSRPLAQYAQPQPTTDSKLEQQHSQSQPFYNNNRPLQQYGPPPGPPPSVSTGLRYYTDREQDYNTRRSLDQQRRPSATDQAPLSSYPPRSASRPRTATGDEKPLPIVRPADIYARMAEEQAKARRSQETSRPTPHDIRGDDNLRSPDGRDHTSSISDEPTPRYNHAERGFGYGPSTVVDKADKSVEQRSEASTETATNVTSSGLQPPSMEELQLSKAQSAAISDRASETHFNQPSNTTTTTGGVLEPGAGGTGPLNRPVAAVVQPRDVESPMRQDSEMSESDMRSTSEEYRDWARRSRQFNASHGITSESPTTPGPDATDQFNRELDRGTSSGQSTTSLPAQTVGSRPDIDSTAANHSRENYRPAPAITRMAGVALPGMTRALGIDPLLQSDRREVEPLSTASTSNKSLSDSKIQNDKASHSPVQLKNFQSPSIKNKEAGLVAPSTSTTSDSAERASDTKITSLRAPANSTKLSTVASRPLLDRDESFRPSIPGGWQSSEHVPQVPSIDETVEGTTRSASTESIPTATAPRDPDWRSEYERDPVKNPGSALAGAFSGRALTRRDSGASSVSADDDPVGANRNPTVAARDFAASPPNTTSSTTATVERARKTTDTPLNSKPNVRNNEQSQRDLSPSRNSDDWWSDEDESKSASQDVPPPLRTNRPPDYRQSQTFSQLHDTNQSREQLHDEIVRSLTPKASSVRNETDLSSVNRSAQKDDAPAVPSPVPYTQGEYGPHNLRRANSNYAEPGSKYNHDPVSGRNHSDLTRGNIPAFTSTDRETSLDDTETTTAGSRLRIGRDHHFSAVGGRIGASSSSELDHHASAPVGPLDSSSSIDRDGHSSGNDEIPRSPGSTNVRAHPSRAASATADSDITATGRGGHASDASSAATSARPLVDGDHHLSTVGGRRNIAESDYGDVGGTIGPALTKNRPEASTGHAAHGSDAPLPTQSQETPAASQFHTIASNTSGSSRSTSQGPGYDGSSIYAGYDHPSLPALPAAVTTLLDQNSASQAPSSPHIDAPRRADGGQASHTDGVAGQNATSVLPETRETGSNGASAEEKRANTTVRGLLPSKFTDDRPLRNAGAPRSLPDNPISAPNESRNLANITTDGAYPRLEHSAEYHQAPSNPAVSSQERVRDGRRQDSTPLSPIYSDAPSVGTTDHGSYIDRVNSLKQEPSPIAPHTSLPNATSAPTESRTRPPIPAGLPHADHVESSSKPAPPAPRRQRSIHSSVTSPVAERAMSPIYDSPARPLEQITKATDATTTQLPEPRKDEIVPPVVKQEVNPSDGPMMPSGAESNSILDSRTAPRTSAINDFSTRAVADPHTDLVARATPVQHPATTTRQYTIGSTGAPSTSRPPASTDSDIHEKPRTENSMSDQSATAPFAFSSARRESVPDATEGHESTSAAPQHPIRSIATPTKPHGVRFQYNPDRPFPSDRVSYRIISTLPTARERIKALNHNRDAYAEDMGHLEHWLSTVDMTQHDKFLGPTNTYTTGSSAQSTPSSSRLQTRPGFDSNTSGRAQVRGDARALLNVGKGFLAKSKDRLRTVSAGTKAPPFRQVSSTSGPSTTYDTASSRNAAYGPVPRLPEPASTTPIEESSFSRIFDDTSKAGDSTLSPVISSNDVQRNGLSRTQPSVATSSVQASSTPLNANSSAGANTMTNASHERRNSGVSDVSSISGIPRANSFAARTVSPPNDHPGNNHASIAAATGRKFTTHAASDDGRRVASFRDNQAENERPVGIDSTDPERQNSQPFSFVHGDSMSHGGQQTADSIANNILDPGVDRVTESPLPSTRRPPEEIAKFRTAPMPITESRRLDEEPYRIPGPYTRELRSPRPKSQTPIDDQPVEQQFAAENPNLRPSGAMVTQPLVPDPARQAYPESIQANQLDPIRPSMDARRVADQRPEPQTRRSSFFSRLSGRQSIDQDRPPVPGRRKSRDLFKFGGQGPNVDQSRKKKNRLSAIFGGGGGRSTGTDRATAMPVEQRQYADSRQSLESHEEQILRQNMYSESVRQDHAYPTHVQDQGYPVEQPAGVQHEHIRQDMMTQSSVPHNLQQPLRTDDPSLPNNFYAMHGPQYDRPELRVQTDHSNPSYPTSTPPISAFYSEHPANVSTPQSTTAARAQQSYSQSRPLQPGHGLEDADHFDPRNTGAQDEQPINTLGDVSNRPLDYSSKQEKPYTIGLPQDERQDQARQVRRSVIEATSAPTSTTDPRAPITVAERMARSSPAPSKNSSTQRNPPSIHSQTHGPVTSLNMSDNNSDRISASHARDISPQRDATGTQRTQTRRIPATANDHPLPSQLPPHLQNAKQGGTIAELTGSKPDGYESEEEVVMSANARPGMEWQPAFEPWED